jgi:hypothetical protein
MGWQEKRKIVMITYYCYFGDPIIGQNFVKIIFGEIKVIPFFEEELIPDLYGDGINKISIRYFIDGDISQYPEVKEDKVHYSKKYRCISIDFHLKKEVVEEMDLRAAFKYFKSTTLKAIEMSGIYCDNKNISFNSNKLGEDLSKLFENIYKKVVDIQK